MKDPKKGLNYIIGSVIEVGLAAVAFLVMFCIILYLYL